MASHLKTLASNILMILQLDYFWTTEASLATSDTGRALNTL